MPSGSDTFEQGLVRHDGGWLFTDPDGGQRWWTPDANVLAVALG